MLQTGKRMSVSNFFVNLPICVSPNAYMYQVDPGNVYIYPSKIFKHEVSELRLPEGFDSI